MDDTPGPSPQVAALLEKITDIVTEQRRTDARLLELIDTLTLAGGPAQTGHRSTSRLLQDLLHIDRGEADKLTAWAPLVTRQPGFSAGPLEPVLPATAEALTGGAMSRGHLAVIAEAMTHAARIPHLTPTQVTDTETKLATLATSRSPRALARDAEEILDGLDSDGQVPAEPARPDQELRLSTGRGGSLSGRFRFTDPEAADTIRTALEALTPEPDPDEPGVPARTLDERRAAALHDMAADTLGHPYAEDAADGAVDEDTAGLWPHDAEPADPQADDPQADDPHAGGGAADDRNDEGTLDAGGAPAGKRRGRTPPKTQGGDAIGLIATIPLEVLEQRLRDLGGLGYGLLDGQWPLHPDTARRLACDADVIPAVLGTHGEILDLGRKTRVVSTAQRRALIARDRHCAHPGCRRRPRHCRAHHIVPWAAGGPTDLDNLVLLCAYHHHLVHHSGWAIHMRHGIPTFIPPAWQDPLRTPLTNNPTTPVGAHA